MCNPHSSRQHKIFCLISCFYGEGVKSSFGSVQEITKGLWCSCRTRVDSNSSFLSNSSSSQLLPETWHTRTHHNTPHTHSQGILFSLHQAIIQNKAYSNLPITVLQLINSSTSTVELIYLKRIQEMRKRTHLSIHLSISNTFWINGNISKWWGEMKPSTVCWSCIWL